MTTLATTVTHDQSAWDAAIRDAGAHFLQSWRWGDFKSRFGWSVERVHVATHDGEGWAQVLFRSRGPVSVGYCPRGPVMQGDATNVWPALRAEIDRVARTHRAITVILEPDRPVFEQVDLATAGIKPGPAHNQPARTVMLPIATDDEMLANMHSKTRYKVRLAGRRGVQIETRSGSDKEAIDAFYALLLDTSDRNKFGVHSREYYHDFLRTFGDDAALILAYSEGNLCAAVIVAAFGDTTIYMYGASSTVHRGHGAAFLLQFEGMKWGRSRGCTQYDLWGIPKDDPESTTRQGDGGIAGSSGDDWAGIYRFKTSFGGEIITQPDTVERERVPVLPWLARRLGVIQE